MKYPLASPLFAVLLFCCSGGDRQEKPDRTKWGIIGGRAVVFASKEDAENMKVLTRLAMGTTVYLLSDTISAKDINYVKVFYNDTTTGYVPRAWVIPEGQLGAMAGTMLHPTTVYEDEEQQRLAFKFNDRTQMVCFKEISPQSTRIMYPGERGERIEGYISTPVFSDSLSLELCAAFTAATKPNINSAAWDALKVNEKYTSLPLHLAIFKNIPASPTIVENKHASGDIEEMKWVDKDGNALTGVDIPGQFELHYIAEGRIESIGNHLGDTLQQGSPGCDNLNVLNYKLVFIPASKMDVKFTVAIRDIAAEEGPMVVSFKNAEPGKPLEYVVTHSVYGTSCDDTTFTVTTSLGHTGTGMVSAWCGD